MNRQRYRLLEYRVHCKLTVCCLPLEREKQFAILGGIYRSITRDNQLTKWTRSANTTRSNNDIKPQTKKKKKKTFSFFQKSKKVNLRVYWPPPVRLQINTFELGRWRFFSVLIFFRLFILAAADVSSSFFKVALYAHLYYAKRRRGANSIKRSTRVHGHSCIQRVRQQKREPYTHTHLSIWQHKNSRIEKREAQDGKEK